MASRRQADWRCVIAAYSCLLLAVAVNGQQGVASRSERAWADSALHALEQNKERDCKRTVEVTARMLVIYGRDRDRCRQAYVSTFRSMCFDQLGELDSDMATMQRSFDWFGPGCDSLVLVRAYLSQSNVLITLEDYNQAHCASTPRRFATDPPAGANTWRHMHHPADRRGPRCRLMYTTMSTDMDLDVG